MPLRDKLASLKKLQKVQGIDKILPANWRRPSNGQELINSSTVLLPAYSLIACVSAAIFAVQWVYYGSLTETISEVADVTLGGYTCSALQKDPIYEKKWTYEECLTSSEYSAPSTVSMINPTPDLDVSSSGWGYKYFPFGANTRSYDASGNCTAPSNIPQSLIVFPSSFDLSTSCPGVSVNASCQFVLNGNIFTPLYVETNGNTLFWKFPDSGRCEAYEKQCVVQAINQVLPTGEGDACDPCETFKSNSPFLCKKSQKKKPLEILSLSVSNTLAVFSLLVAVTPIFLTKPPTAEQDFDVEEASR